MEKRIIIGCLDVLYETAIMSKHMAMPRQGHLEQVLHIFGYLNRILASDFPESHKHKKLISQRTVRAILDSRIPTKSSQWAASNGGFYIFVGSKPVPGWQFSIDRPSWWKTSNLRVIRIFHHEDVFKSENWVHITESS